METAKPLAGGTLKALPLVRFVFQRSSFLLYIIGGLSLMILDMLGKESSLTIKAPLLQINLKLEKISSYPSQTYHYFSDKINTLWLNKDDIGHLKQQARDQQKWEIKARILQRENLQLKKLLRLAPQKTTSYVTGEISSRSKSFSEDSFRLLLSKTNTVTPFSPVVLGSTLIGYVKECGTNSAIICPVTASQSRVPVVSEKTGIKAIIAGLNHGKMKILHTHENSSFEEGELLLSTSDGALYPDHYAVGRITYRGTTTPHVDPLFSAAATAYVFVLPPLERE